MRNVLIYVVTGLGLLAVTLLLAAYAPNITHAWFSFGAFTILLVAVLARMYWPVRKSAKVWLLLAFFMVVHIVAYAFLLQRVPRWPSLLYVVTGPVEVMLFATIAKVWLDVLPPKVKL